MVTAESAWARASRKEVPVAVQKAMEEAASQHGQGVAEATARSTTT
jgi:hypothetical protein